MRLILIIYSEYFVEDVRYFWGEYVKCIECVSRCYDCKGCMMIERERV